MVDTALLLAFIQVESGFNARAFLNDRNGGSYGLMQVDLSTVEDRGFQGSAVELYEPVVNVQYGAKVLAWLGRELEKAGIYSVENLAAAYNSGLEHVKRGGTDKNYSDKLLAALARWQLALAEAQPSGV